MNIIKSTTLGLAGLGLTLFAISAEAKRPVCMVLHGVPVQAYSGDGTVRVTNDFTPNQQVSEECARAKSGMTAAPAPAPKVVAAKPKLDSDGDGVWNAFDKCADTPKGTQVNRLGCSETQNFSVKIEVNFDSGKAVVKPEYRSELEKLAEFMGEHKGTSVTVEGHTDSTGNINFNNMISKKRAEAVKSYLVSEFGVSSDRLSAKGYGPDKPVAENDTSEGRARNRRVMANISVTK